MKIVIAPDSFKECLSSPDAAGAIARGVRRACPDAVTAEVPMADGGEGTVRALVAATDGRLLRTAVQDPLGREIEAEWGLCGDGRTAAVEMAAASGLERLAVGERDPMAASTFGTGQLIAAALDHGVERIVIGIGGSATVDGGTGMAAAFGVRFLDQDGREVPACGASLPSIAAIDRTGLDPRVGGCEIVVACDVTNPLTGVRGAARTYGPQKGASPAQVEELEAGLRSLAGVIRRDLGTDVEDLPGAGAAGGLGAGLVAFAGARLERGVEVVMESCRFRERLAGADLVITGEGRVDGQSAFGKTVAGVAAAAAERGVPVLVLAGSVGGDCGDLYDLGVTAVLSIADRPMSLGEAIARADGLLAQTAEAAVRLWCSGGGRADG
jgi:glycerate kinase